MSPNDTRIGRAHRAMVRAENKARMAQRFGRDASVLWREAAVLRAKWRRIGENENASQEHALAVYGAALRRAVAALEGTDAG